MPSAVSEIDFYLMSPPALSWAIRGRANFRSASADPVDALGARREWLALADAIEARGGRVLCLVPEPGGAPTGLPYAAECGQVVRCDGKPIFLLPNMAVEHRRAERGLWQRFAERLGMATRTLAGTWEAQGDVATFGDHTLLFYGGRTNAEGLAAARPYFNSPIVSLRIREPAFHGNMAVLPLPAIGRLVVCPEVICDEGNARLATVFGQDRIVEVTEAEIRQYATNGLPIGAELLAPHLLPARVQRELESLGMHVNLLDMVELCEKAGGASRCLVSHARIDPDDIDILPECDYRNRRAELVAECRD